ncbi:uncharacterized protein PAF06_000450 [Gastrophryne carolinensis]
MDVSCKVTSRFARTLITSEIHNPLNSSQKAVFDVELPKTAFISNFSMTIDGVTSFGVVKKKLEASEQYNRAVSRGQSAGLVQSIGRKMENFQISVNVGAQATAIFQLTYEELLKRRLGVYELRIQVRPKQLVENFQIEVDILEPQTISFLDTKATFMTNDLEDAVAISKNGNKAHILFKPTIDQQRKCPLCLKTLLDGDFVLKYDVERERSAGDIQIVNGYFVHYFAPSSLTRLPKNVVFVIDCSGSMKGRKMEQTFDAFTKILEDLPEDDFFSILKFNAEVTKWKNNLVRANTEYIKSAKQFVAEITATGATNINSALVSAAEMLKMDKMQKVLPEASASIIIFLSDGDPTSGVTNLADIRSNVQEAVGGEATLYSLGFGTDVDFSFLEKISLDNGGLARRIYEDSDSALQLQNFYQEVAFPVLLDVNLQYPNHQVNDLTQSNFRYFYQGSELIVAGHIQDNNIDILTAQVTAQGVSEQFSMKVERNVKEEEGIASQQRYIFGDFTERLWAYLTIEQLLTKQVSAKGDIKRNITEEALDLSLKYSFVSPLTSMVITTSEADDDEKIEVVANKPKEGGYGNHKPISGHVFQIMDTSSPIVATTLNGQLSVKRNSFAKLGFVRKSFSVEITADNIAITTWQITHNYTWASALQNVRHLKKEGSKLVLSINNGLRANVLLDKNADGLYVHVEKRDRNSEFPMEMKEKLARLESYYFQSKGPEDPPVSSSLKVSKKQRYLVSIESSDFEEEEIYAAIESQKQMDNLISSILEVLRILAPRTPRRKKGDPYRSEKQKQLIPEQSHFTRLTRLIQKEWEKACLFYVKLNLAQLWNLKELIGFWKRTKAFFSYFPSSKTSTNPNLPGIDLTMCKAKSTWSPPPSSHAVETFINLVEKDFSQIKPPSNSKNNNLSFKESQALQALSQNSDFTIKPADKGGAIVVMNSADYCNEILSQLADSTKKMDIHRMHIESKVTSRFSRTLITMEVRNPANFSQEAVFDIELPKTAFITSFSMTVDNVTNVGVVKEKIEAKRQYQAAMSRGKSAGLVQSTGRKMEHFKVSVNVGSQAQAIFKLTYEELLKRQLGSYELYLRVRPRKLVQNFQINVDVVEQQGISFLKTVGTFISNELADIIMINRTETEAHIEFKPTMDQQRSCPNCVETVLDGELMIKYDVKRESAVGKVQVINGYFVHYFAPPSLKRIPKNVVFVIDHSGSMYGNKIKQTYEAFLKILEDVPEEDHFGILIFDDKVDEWKTYLVKAVPENIKEAKQFVSRISARGGTDINKALLTAAKMLRNATINNMLPKVSASIIIFLSDGEPTSGTTNHDKIIDNLKRSLEGQASLYCLGFGRDVDYNFLEKLALENGGLARRIYEDSDSALQLQGFYNEVAYPMLLDVRLQYLDNSVDDLTQSSFRHYYQGSEIIVAGHITNNSLDVLSAEVTAQGVSEPFSQRLETNLKEEDNVAKEQHYIFRDFTERLWAYLTIEQLLTKLISLEGQEKRQVTEKTLNLSLKYHFVTPLTSIVVTPPEKEDTHTKIVAHKPKEDEQSRDFEFDDFQDIQSEYLITEAILIQIAVPVVVIVVVMTVVVNSSHVGNVAGMEVLVAIVAYNGNSSGNIGDSASNSVDGNANGGELMLAIVAIV